MTEACKAEIYPRYCFHLSPTVNTWCFLTASNVHALQQHAGFEGEGFFFYNNLPIKWVRIVGPVVAIDEYRGRRVFTVDDSSGKCIEAWVNITIPTPECNASDPMEAQSGKTTTGNVGRAGILQAQDSTGPYNEIDVGDIADVKGSISLFMTEKQIKVEKMMIVKSTTLEVALWRKRSTFHRDILDKPWILRQKDIRRCRRAAETSEEGLKQQKQNKKPLKAATTACASTETRRTQPLIANTPRESTRYRSKDKSKPVDVTERLRDLIRDGSVKGKYSALGL